MKKRLLAAFLTLTLFSSYSLHEKLIFNYNLNIKEIIIENNLILDTKKIEKKLSFLFDTNIFFLKSIDIEKNLNKIDIIDSFQVKRIFPDKIIIKIYEKKPIAILQNKKEKKYYTSQGNVIDYFNKDELDDLPIVFGDKNNFKIFHNSLKNINFPINEIKKFYFYNSIRWDIMMKKDRIIKLPIKNYKESLINYMNLRENSNFKKYNIFDYRIKDQLILK